MAMSTSRRRGFRARTYSDSIAIVDERAERIGRNEDLFRKVNDQIEGVNEAFGTITGTMSLLCECGKLECIEQIDLTVDAYRELRADPTRFAVKLAEDLA